MQTWAEISTQIKKSDETKRDYLIKRKNIHQNNLRIVLNDKEYEYTEWSRTQLLGKLEIPNKYITRLPTHIQDQLVNHDLTNSDKEFFFRTFENGQNISRAFLSNKYSEINNSEIAEIMDRVTAKFRGEIKHLPSVDADTMWVKILIPDLQKDELQCGILVGNSEIGSRMFEVQPFVYRKPCTNDAVFQGGVVQRHIHLSKDELYNRAAIAVNLAIKNAGKALDDLLKTRDIKIEDPLDVIKQIAEKNNYSKRFTDEIVSASKLETEINGTAYGVINAITRTAQKLSINQRIDIEKEAGKLVYQWKWN